METKGAYGLALSEAAQVLRLLGDETRLQILLLLAEQGETHVTALCAALGLSQTAVSHHLTLLRLGRLIEYRRDGKNNLYRITAAIVNDLLWLTLARGSHHQAPHRRATRTEMIPGT